MSKNSMTSSKKQRANGVAWLAGASGSRTKRDFNRSLVCAALFHEGPRSRVDLKAATGLPPSRLSEICGSLLDDGVIREGMVTPASGGGRGRPRAMLELDLRRLGVACVSYNQDHTTTALVDLAGAVLWKRRWNVTGESDATSRLKSIAGHLKETIAVAAELKLPLVGVGAADPGTVDIATGRSIRAVNVPGWTNVPVVETLNDETGLTSVIERSDGWQALGEVTYGAGRGSQHALFVTLLEGVGGGIVEGGRLLSGRDGSAGEIGHTRVSLDGPLCGCGARGCLEAHLAPQRLALRWKGATPAELDNISLRQEGADDHFDQMLKALKQNDPKATQVLADAARALAAALGNAVSLLNPERIVLGGRFVETGDLFLSQVQNALPEFALPELVSNVSVRLAELGDDSTYLGIAAYVRSRLFAYPSMGASIDVPLASKRK